MIKNNSEEFIGKIVVFAAPSGAGKTTIVRHILQCLPNIDFSVSATTRKARDYEKEGVHYYFLSVEEFKKRIKNNEFVEYEQVYDGIYYGTLKSELERLWGNKKHIVFDIDVKGALSIKKIYGDRAITIFVEPPSIEELVNRLRARGTEDEASIKKRVAKFNNEMEFLDKFDYRLVNDNLEKAFYEAEEVVQAYLKNNHD